MNEWAWRPASEKPGVSVPPFQLNMLALIQDRQSLMLEVSIKEQRVWRHIKLLSYITMSLQQENATNIALFQDVMSNNISDTTQILIPLSILAAVSIVGGIIVWLALRSRLRGKSQMQDPENNAVEVSESCRVMKN